MVRICLPMQEERISGPLVQGDPTAVEQLSPCATTTEPVLESRSSGDGAQDTLEPMLCNKRAISEKPSAHN